MKEFIFEAMKLAIAEKDYEMIKALTALLVQYFP